MSLTTSAGRGPHLAPGPVGTPVLTVPRRPVAIAERLPLICYDTVTLDNMNDINITDP